MSIKSFLSGFVRKAGSVGITNADGQVVGNNLNILYGNTYQQDKSPQNLIKFYNGWVSICNSKNANTCASIPLKLYYYNKGKKLQATRYKELDEDTQKVVAKGLRIELKSKEEQIVEITEHPVLDLFAKINDTMNYYDWCALNFEYLGTIGNSYNEIVYDSNGLPIELNPLLGEFVIPIATGKKQGKIIRYEYKPENVLYKYNPEQILQFSNYVPGNLLIGRGELENCLSAQERYCYYDAYEKFLGLNNARPDIAFNYKNKLNVNDMKEMYKQIMKRFSGVQNSGKPIITTGDVDIKNLGFAPRDLSYQVGRDWARQEICAAYGVPISMVTTDEVNRANAIAGMNQYLRNTIYPKMVKFCSKINEQVTPKYDKDLFIWVSEEYLEDPVEKTQNIIATYNAGIIDRNEARIQMGLMATKDNGNNGNSDNSQGE
jgi:HK97 family phage portal protein